MFLAVLFKILLKLLLKHWGLYIWTLTKIRRKLLSSFPVSARIKKNKSLYVLCSLQLWLITNFIQFHYMH